MRTKKEKETENKETVEQRSIPRPLTAEEKKAALLFVPGHNQRESVHDTSGKELLASKGEDTELLTKTRLRGREVTAQATLEGLIDRINRKQQYCAICGKLGIPTLRDVNGKDLDKEFKCTHKVTKVNYVMTKKPGKIKVDGYWFWSKAKYKVTEAEYEPRTETVTETVTWQPYYWDSLQMTVDKLLAGRISLDGKEREEFIKHHEGTQIKEHIDREVGGQSTNQQVV